MTQEPSTKWEINEQFRLMVESVRDYAIFMLDPQGYITTWNEGAERVKGWKAEDVIGQHFSCFYLPEDAAAGKPEQWLRVAAEEGRFQTEGWRRRKDGSRFWADVVITALRDPQGELLGFVKITRDLTERMQTEQMLHQLSSQILRIQDEERQRIGRDLHDSLGQYLVALKLRLDLLESSFSPGDPVRQKLADCIQLAEDTLREVRATSYELYPPLLEEVGLTSAVPWFLDGFMDRSGITTTFKMDACEDDDRPPREVELATFRVLQESLTNVRKHSQSSHADIRLEIKDHVVKLEVADQGSGIPHEILEAFRRGSPGKLGIGLRGMKERVGQLGGSMEVNSNGTGTAVRCAIPYETLT